MTDTADDTKIAGSIRNRKILLCTAVNNDSYILVFRSFSYNKYGRRDELVVSALEGHLHKNGIPEYLISEIVEYLAYDSGDEEILEITDSKRYLQQRSE